MTVSFMRTVRGAVISMPQVANVYGDEGHRQGWCLYKLGCKGPVTHAPCSTLHFNELPGVWPIGIGAPCAGCTEKATAFRIPLFQTVDIHAITPPETFPSSTRQPDRSELQPLQPSEPSSAPLHRGGDLHG